MDLGKKIILALEGGFQLILLTNLVNVLLGLYYLKNKNFRNVMLGIMKIWKWKFSIF